MKTQILKNGIYLLIASFCFVLMSLILVSYKQIDSKKGKATIQLDRLAEDEITIIKIKTPKAHITLRKDDGIWKVSEADMYYANLQAVENLLTFAKESKIHREVILNDKEFQENFGTNATEISYGNEQKGIEKSIIIGKLTYNNRFVYIRYPQEEKIYMVSQGIKLPEYTYNWLHQPLISIDSTTVQDIIIDEGGKQITIRRDTPGYPFWIISGGKMVKQAYPEDLLNQIKAINFIDVKSAQNFDESWAKETKNIKITTYEGMVVLLKLMKKEKEYWIKQILSTTSLPTSYAKDYINKNEELSNYWYFRLSNYTGSRMWNNSIIR